MLEGQRLDVKDSHLDASLRQKLYNKHANPITPAGHNHNLPTPCIIVLFPIVQDTIIQIAAYPPDETYVE